MKITVNADGRDHAIRVPTALLFTIIKSKSKEAGKERKINYAARKRFNRALKDAKKRYGDMAIVEVKSKDGENVEIRL